MGDNKNIESPVKHQWKAIFISCFIVLGVCEFFIILDVIGDYLYIDFLFSVVDHSLMELIIMVTLGVSLIFLGRVVWRLLRVHRTAEETVRAASGEFLKVISRKFDDWRLSPSEQEIAYLLMKGFSVNEICALRNTRPGTVKSQSNAIYRKAGLRGRNELVAFFVEDLLAGDELLRAPPALRKDPKTAG